MYNSRAKGARVRPAGPELPGAATAAGSSGHCWPPLHPDAEPPHHGQRTRLDAAGAATAASPLSIEGLKSPEIVREIVILWKLTTARHLLCSLRSSRVFRTTDLVPIATRRVPSLGQGCHDVRMGTTLSDQAASRPQAGRLSGVRTALCRLGLPRVRVRAQAGVSDVRCDGPAECGGCCGKQRLPMQAVEQ